MKMTDHLDLTVPQMRLMHIFDTVESKGDFDDRRARAMLDYLRELANESATATPTLDAFLTGTLPPLDFYWYYDAVLREAHQADCSGPAPDQVSLGEYHDALLNCFPRIFLELFPTPEKTVDPARNLLVTWEMGYGWKIREELWHAPSEVREISKIIFDYIETCVNGFPFQYQNFLTRWTHYLLTREWPDNAEELDRERRLRLSYQEVNAHLAAENQAYREASQDHFITIIDAARAVLRLEFGQDDIEAQAEALKKRIMRCNPGLTSVFSGKLRRKYFAVGRVIDAFKRDKTINLTNNAIHDAIRAKAMQRCDLEE